MMKILHILAIVGMIQTKNELINYISFVIYFLTIKRFFSFGGLKYQIKDFLLRSNNEYILGDFIIPFVCLIINNIILLIQKQFYVQHVLIQFCIIGLTLFAYELFRENKNEIIFKLAQKNIICVPEDYLLKEKNLVRRETGENRNKIILYSEKDFKKFLEDFHNNKAFIEVFYSIHCLARPERIFENPYDAPNKHTGFYIGTFCDDKEKYTGKLKRSRLFCYCVKAYGYNVPNAFSIYKDFIKDKDEIDFDKLIENYSKKHDENYVWYKHYRSFAWKGGRRSLDE